MGKRIEVSYKDKDFDSLGSATREKIKEFLNINVNEVRTVDAYNIDSNLSDKELKKLGKEVFSDPIIHDFSVKEPLAKDFDFLIEVEFRPGVTDNVGRTSSEAIKDLLKKDCVVFTSKQFLIKGKITRKDAEKIATGLLANDLIEKTTILEKPKTQMQAILPIVRGEAKPVVNTINLNVSDKELMEISKQGVLALNLEEMKAIQEHFKKLGRNPTDAELEVLAQTWSEHCKHKIFNATITYEEQGRKEVIHSLFNKFIKGTTDTVGQKVDFLVSVFKDNAGVIRFDKENNLVFKVETHNSPSALDPYGGALTGIVGVNRDTLGTGISSRPIFNTDVFCFARPDYDKPVPKRLMHPKRIFEGVRKGVEHGGNKSGIPTVNGSIVFDDRFLGKPLVYCGTGGVMPKVLFGKDTSEKTIEPGDIVIMTGGRVGKDGIHGATFSSEELHEGSPATAVQIGDPITQKKMLDFILEARDNGWIKSITDNGAGGLSSSVGEMCEESGGANLYLEKVPLKYSGLQPWEIIISEAQERMTIGIAKENLDKFMDLAKRRGVEATAVGKFTDSGRFVAAYKGEKVMELDLDFLYDGVPIMKLDAKWKQKEFEEPNFEVPKDLSKELLKILARPNVCSKEWTVRQYDHEVQGASVVKPFVGEKNDGPSDAAIIRPIYGSDEGCVVAHGIVPRYSDIDTYHMTAAAIDEAVRNHVAVGGDLDILAALDNFCWCDPIKSEKTPDGEYKLAQLVRANKALYNYCTAYNMPLISGKDSMKNDYMIGDTKISIPPTILISTIGKIDDVKKAVTMDAKKKGDLVYVLGTTKKELGGSEYFAQKGFIGNSVPKVDAKSAYKLYQALNQAIRKKLVSSAHDCSDGGLGVALAETAFSGGLGMELDLTGVDNENVSRDDYLLFSETQSRFVVTVSPNKKKSFENTLEGNPFSLIGKVTGSNEFVIKNNGKEIVKTTLGALKNSWKRTLQW
ncbi:phosphoribosylformylglycinamidine synthase subunit PurL [Candidatus Woesearchaeota archaeon]|nr:phosphoribosylformylglycinamidine synthase subunit PurL [Candidatus Woesearchaeota archaeon]